MRCLLCAGSIRGGTIKDHAHTNSPAEELTQNPALADFVAPLPPLAESRGEAFGRTTERLADLLAESSLRARIHFGVIRPDDEERPVHSWSITAETKECTVSEEQVHLPDLEVLAFESVWEAMANGDIAPLDAFTGSGMRVRGDLIVARHLARIIRRGKRSGEQRVEGR